MNALETTAASRATPLGSVLKISTRNLLRYRRRTVLTTLLIAVGVIAVLMFVALAGSFRAMMVGQITDSMLGHVQIHRRGYLAAIDNLPLNMNVKPKMLEKIEAAVRVTSGISATSPRLKFGAMFSNFAETTSVRVVAVVPEREAAVAPLLPGRVIEGEVKDGLVARGGILVPELVARGMKVKVGDEVVLVATNQDGSVNGRTFKVQGVLGSVTGPGGRDGYVHIEDARALLRLKEADVSELAIRLDDPSRAAAVAAALSAALAGNTTPQGAPALEVHSWHQLTPFYNIARMIDLMTLFIQVMLVSIVLISVMNVMMMAVYERVREIGTIAAIGTQPKTILALFLGEGLLLGLVGAAAGTAVSLVAIAVLNATKVAFQFGREDLLLAPAVSIGAVLWTVAVVVAVAILASLQPAWRASRMDPNTALRHV